MHLLDTALSLLGAVGVGLLAWHRWVIHPREVKRAYDRGQAQAVVAKVKALTDDA